MLGMFELKSTKTRGDDVAMAKVPAAVKKAAEKAVPGGKWESAFSETIFELEGTDGKGRTVVVEVTDDGEVNEVSTELPVKEVPETVLSALKSKMPRFKIETVFESRQGGKVAGFSFEGKRPRDKEEIGVFVSPDGKTIEFDEEA
jgi:hypothetical protein